MAARITSAVRAQPMLGSDSRLSVSPCAPGAPTTMPSREDDVHRSADSGGPYHPTRSIGLASAEDRIVLPGPWRSSSGAWPTWWKMEA
jgi:hypothetical protein